mmetsp:Transcript_44993/g.40249  ORF Transcript_44993/g.40249 Transcript_44993/m.40249 type:complete len:177 (+) Transcript_44993:1-531(+)
MEIDETSNGHDNDVEMNGNNHNTETDDNQPPTKAFWTIFNKPETGKRSGLIRVVITKGETLKDVILRDILPYLKVSKSISSTPSKSTSNTSNNKDNKEESPTKTEEDILFDNIIDSYKFKLRGGGVTNTQLTETHLKSTRIYGMLKPEESMYLYVQMPIITQRSYNWSDRPLTIDG